MLSNSALCVAKRLKEPKLLGAITDGSRMQTNGAGPFVQKVLGSLAPTGIEVIGADIVKYRLQTLGPFGPGAQFASIVAEQTFCDDNIAELRFFTPAGADANHRNATWR